MHDFLKFVCLFFQCSHVIFFKLFLFYFKLIVFFVYVFLFIHNIGQINFTIVINIVRLGVKVLVDGLDILFQP